ncbi:hypothetical protein ACNKHR_20450 [Shigella flexneri]
MQQAKEAAAETKAQRAGAFRLMNESGIIQAEFTQRVTEGFIVVELPGTDRRLPAV